MPPRRTAKEAAEFTNAIANHLSVSVQVRSLELGWSDDSPVTLLCWLHAALAFAGRTAPVALAVSTKNIAEAREIYLREAASHFDDQVTFLISEAHGSKET